MSRRSGYHQMNGEVQQLSLDVLAARQANTDQAVQHLQSEFSSGFSKLESQLGALAEKMASSGKPNWPLIVGFLTMLVAVISAGWGFGVHPLESKLSELAGGQHDIAAAIAMLPQTYVSKQDYTDARMIFRQDNAARQAEIDAQIEARVPRTEYEAAIGGVQRQIDDLSDALGGIYGARELRAQKEQP